MKLTKREKVLIYFAIIFGVIAIYYQYYLTPKILEIKNLSADLQSKKQILQQLSNLKDKNLKENLANEQIQLKDLNEILPENKDLEIFLFNLQQILNDTGVRIKSLNFEKVDQTQKEGGNVKKEDFVTVPVNIVVLGNYDEIMSFLKEMQNLKRLFSIQSFSIEKGQSNQNLLLNLNAFIYSMKDSGGTSIPTEFQKGKVDPFKPLYDETKNRESNGQSNIGEQTSTSQNIDVNKIISDTIEKILKEKIPSLP
ncbi:MAG TPA: type 4a pilus biogenesis protein PilO [Clostridia bacterium]|nr:type 4a pilus biogenesis protein PilO [Clostridia bacterium]